MEGKYDKIRLLSVIDAQIITLDGFGIFKDKEKSSYLKRLAEKSGVIVLTDSDGGGLVIRNYLRSMIPADKITNLYIPEIKGKEKRKSESSKEGLLGVEGIENELLYDLFLPFSAKNEMADEKKKVTQAILYADGFVGGQGSREKRKVLLKKLSLPQNISTSSLIEAINLLYGYDEYKEMIKNDK